MLDKEVKDILQEQFSKDRNYQKVLNNVDNKSISYNKIFKFALIPTCAVVLAAIIVPNINNNDNNYKGIAQINTIVEEQETNTIVEIADKNETEETPKIEETTTIQAEIEKNNQNKENKTNVNITPKDNSLQVKVAKGTIYKTIEGGQSSWAYDPTIPSNIINDHIETKSVVKVKILSVGEGEMLPKQEKFDNPYTCHTPIKMQIIDNLLDTNTISGTITAYITGGKIKIANILKGSEQQIKNMGIQDISQLDEEQYIEYKWSVPYYEPNVGDEYVIILNKTNSSLYQISCGGYGIFKVEKASGGKEVYKNVVSDKLLEM